ncbi:hypothetical protein QUA81_22205 [Microcoleus sp. F6_B4]
MVASASNAHTPTKPARQGLRNTSDTIAIAVFGRSNSLWLWPLTFQFNSIRVELGKSNSCGPNLSLKNIVLSAAIWVGGLWFLFFSQSTDLNLCKRLICKLQKMGTIKMGLYCRAVTTSNTISEIIQEGVNV